MSPVCRVVCSSMSPARGPGLGPCRCGYSELLPPAQTGQQETRVSDLQQERNIMKLEKWGIVFQQKINSYTPDNSVMPHRCLPLNPLVLREQAQGCWDSMFLSSSLCKSTGNTAGPTSLSSSFLLVPPLEGRKSNDQENKIKKINYLFLYSSFLFFFFFDFFLDLQVGIFNLIRTQNTNKLFSLPFVLFFLFLILIFPFGFSSSFNTRDIDWPIKEYIL